MIRHFPAFFKPNHNNYSEIELFNRALKCFRPEKARCPSCKSKGSFLLHDSYERDLITYDGGVRAHEITIPRYKCGSCGKPHSVIPDMLIPYGSYSLCFVLTVLKAYFFRNCPGNTVEGICDKYQIAVSTLYAWKERFSSHKSLWLGAATSLSVTNTDFLAEHFLRPGMLSGFFCRFGFSFMQNHLASTSAVP
jgi:hypothetical protein